MLSQYDNELESYKDRKFRAQKELESVQYGLEDEAEKQQSGGKQAHLLRVDKIKSRVSEILINNCLRFRLELSKSPSSLPSR